MKNYQISPLTFFIMSQSVLGVKASLLPCLTSVPVCSEDADLKEGLRVAKTEDEKIDCFRNAFHREDTISEYDGLEEMEVAPKRPFSNVEVFDEPEDLLDHDHSVMKNHLKGRALKSNALKSKDAVSDFISEAHEGQNSSLAHSDDSFLQKDSLKNSDAFSSLPPEDRIVQLSKQLFLKHAEQMLGSPEGKKMVFSDDLCAPNHLFSTPPRYRMRDLRFDSWSAASNASSAHRFVSLTLQDVPAFVAAVLGGYPTPEAVSLEFDALVWEASVVPLVLQLKELQADVWIKIKHPSVWETIDETVLHKSVQVGWSWWCDMHAHADVLWAHLNASKPHWRFWLLHHQSNQWVWPWCDILAHHLARKLNAPVDRYWIADHRQKTVWGKIEEEATRSMETILGGSGVTGALFLHVLQSPPPALPAE